MTLSITNTDGVSPAAFSECSDPRVTWTFGARSGQLAKTGCVNGRLLNRTSDLSMDQLSQVIMGLQALRTTAVQGTIADAPQVAVVVTNVQSVDSKYSGFPWYPASAAALPTVDSGALFCLENLLDSFVDRPLLLGEWCNDAAACASGLSCRAGMDGSVVAAYCRAD